VAGRVGVSEGPVGEEGPPRAAHGAEAAELLRREAQQYLVDGVRGQQDAGGSGNGGGAQWCIEGCSRVCVSFETGEYDKMSKVKSPIGSTSSSL